MQVIVDEGRARPWLVGRASVINARIDKLGLRLQAGRDYEIVNIDDDARYRDYWQTYHRLTERKGVTEQFAKIEMRRRLTLIAAMLLHKGEVDGMICGTWGSTQQHLAHIDYAIHSVQQALRIDPAHVGALAALAELQRKRGAWSELVETLSRQAAAEKDPAKRAEVNLALGELLENQVMDQGQALSLIHISEPTRPY